MGTQGTAGPNRVTYDAYDANEVHFYGNGAKNNVGNVEDGYFFDLKQAIDEARHFIFIADWSFHPMLVLMRTLPSGQKEFQNKDTIGFQLGEAAKRDGLLVAIHTWNHDLTATPGFINPARDGPNDEGNTWLDRICGGKRPERPERLLWRASAHIGTGFSLHQKFVAMDCPINPKDPDDPNRQVKVFMGGLDITKGRFDWLDHGNLRLDPATAPFLVPTKIEWKGLIGTDSALFNEWYNAEFYDLEKDNKDALNPDLPRQTWHDIHCVIKGPTAWDIVREFVGRWNRTAGGPQFLKGNHDDKAIKTVLDKYEAIMNDANFAKPDSPVANPKGNWKGRILRSLPEKHWGMPDSVKVPTDLLSKFNWTLEGTDFERSIQDYYVDTIRRAKRFVYIETQYLIGSGAKWRNSRDSVKNAIPESIVERTKTMIKQGNPFHTYIVMPMFPEGAPVTTSSSAQWQRKFEFETMRYMAVAVHTEARKNNLSWFHFLSFLFPVRWQQLPSAPSTKGDRKQRIQDNNRYMIYVHSKLMIVDDRFVILGSANLNERSLAGDRDAEICVFLEPGKGKEAAAVHQVNFFRKQLWHEFFVPRPMPAGFTDPPVWDKPESGDCIRWVHGTAFRNYLYFRRGLRSVTAKVSTDQGESIQTFTNDGFLCTYPYDMVRNGLPDSKGDFGILNTNLIKTQNMQEGVLSLSDIRELNELLRRRCPEGDAFLPDPDGTGDEWKWPSVDGLPGIAGAAE